MTVHPATDPLARFNYLDLYDGANHIGWDTPNGRLLTAIAATADPTVCGEFIDTVGPCGGPPNDNHEHEMIRPCCRRSASRCSC